jgi:3-hydroxyisobutyrate dehydrogenase
LLQGASILLKAQGESMETKEIGFIGTGNMGLPMTANLVRAGYPVKAFDIVKEALDSAVAAGARGAVSVQEAVGSVHVVITMLPSGRHVREVYLGEGGVIASASSETLLIDSSTIDVETARDVTQAAEAAGLEMVDAPVSGGVAGAEKGALTFMVGGTEKAFSRAQPVLESMGKTIVHAGGAGNGQAAKICNNMILGMNMIAVSEAFILAEGLGLDAQKLFDIASKASGQCWALTTYCPMPGLVPTSPANKDYQPGFTAEMMLKDLRLSQTAAQNVGAATPLGASATALYTLFHNLGNGKVDFSGIIRMLRGDQRSTC